MCRPMNEGLLLAGNLRLAVIATDNARAFSDFLLSFVSFEGSAKSWDVIGLKAAALRHDYFKSGAEQNTV